MLKSLKQAGYNANQVTDVVLSHLHFDHCGGTTYFDKNNLLRLTFPYAKHWVGREQWENFILPNVREGASYFLEDMLTVKDEGLLTLIDEAKEIAPGITLRLYHGHTPGQIIPFIKSNRNTVVFMADLIPLVASIPLAWVSAYDTFPVKSMQEKEQFLEEAVTHNYLLFFQHDKFNECCTLTRTQKGVREKETGKLKDLANKFVG